MLRSEIAAALGQKPMLLMTHLVLGYPSFEVNRQVVKEMVGAGVDLIELQIPFSEPVADGPVIARACQEAIASGVRVADCLDFAAETAAAHPVPFLFMTYCNIIFRRGEWEFLDRAKAMGVQGLIVPDLPPEEGARFFAGAKERGVAPIPLFAPTTPAERMRELARGGDGFVYVVARRGVTGAKTSFDPGFDEYLRRCREATDLPLAVGFGIRERADVDALRGKAEIAVIGTETIRLVDREGPAAVGPFIASLR